MQNKTIYTILIILGLAIASIFGTFFTVKENEIVFIVQFGKIVRTINSAGLNAKIPLMQEIVVYDKRISQVDVPVKEIISLDQKRLIVDSYAKYRIIDAHLFFQRLRDIKTAEIRINSILDSAIRRVVAKYPLSALLTEQRNKIMDEIRTIVSQQTTDFGVKVLDVRIIRADFPIQNSEAIFSRMRTEREKEAYEVRAKGFQEAEIIKSDADRIGREIMAEATMKSYIIKGKADAEASAILNATFNKDPQFFKFYRQLGIYQQTINKNNTKVIINSNNPLIEGLASSNDNHN